MSRTFKDRRKRDDRFRAEQLTGARILNTGTIADANLKSGKAQMINCECRLCKTRKVGSFEPLISPSKSVFKQIAGLMLPAYCECGGELHYELAHGMIFSSCDKCAPKPKATGY